MKLLLALLLTLSAAGETREITGRVVDDVTGAPIPRVRVTLTFSGQTTVAISTDEAGAFNVKNAPDKPYQVACQRAGYLMVVESGERRTIRMVPQIVIEGVVVDEKGAPVPFATIQIYRQAVVEGHRQPELVSGNPADDTGSFRAFGLRQDGYWVGATVPPRPLLSKTTYAPVFFPNSPDIQGAELMDLHPGDERRLRIKLSNPVPSHEIRGTVATGSEGVSISLRLADEGLTGQPLNVLNRWDARTHEFRISGVAPGRYLLDVMVQSGGQFLGDWRAVTVSEHDVAGLQLRPQPSPSVTGVVRFIGDGAPPGYQPQVELRSPRGRFLGRADAQGNLQFMGVLPGTYRLALTDTGAAYLRSAWQGGRNVMETGLVVSPDLPTQPLEIEVSGPGATIEGSLPESPFVVVALLRRAADGLALVKEWRGAKQFTMPGIGPGDYLLFCWPADAPVAYADPGFLQQNGKQGKEITVKAAGKLHVDLEGLIPVAR